MFFFRLRRLAWVSLSILAFLILTVLSASATTYNAGVKPGDNVKYSHFTASWQSTDANQKKPQYISDYQNTNFLLLTMQSVSGANVTAQARWGFNNGTADESQNLGGSVRDGTGNLTTIGPSQVRFPLLAGANLTTTDLVQLMLGAPKFNSTLSKDYAGASRQVNFVSLTQSYNGNSASVRSQLYFDKITGILLDLFVSSSSTTSGGQTTTSESFTATETNLWSMTILGLSPSLFYCIVEGAIAVAVIVATLLLMRRKKPKATISTQTPAPSPTPTP